MRLTVIAKDLCASVQAALQVELQLSQAWPCRSGEWGIMPFHWYFSSALPRALLGAYPLAVLGLLWEPRVRPRVLLVVAYVLLYSFLPHKEVCDADSVVDRDVSCFMSVSTVCIIKHGLIRPLHHSEAGG
jgi:hypothetical protein